MKIVLERDVLAEAVAWTARALPARPTVPVLAGIRLQAGEDLVLSSFDYDVSAQATVPVTHRRRRAPPWSPAGCSPRSAAACPPSPCISMPRTAARC